jgi:tetratricopeptide (TPR) repeat protein
VPRTRKEVAMRLYRDLIRRTQNPEFMDALARLLRAEEKARQAERLQLTARSIYEQRLERFPEATWGHALRHYLEFGPYDVAVDLAEKNWNLRPNREARELLERAYEKTGGRAVLDQGRPKHEVMDTTESR